MATIVPRSGGFLARVRLKGFKPVSRYFPRRQDAEQWAQGTELAMRQGSYCSAPAQNGRGRTSAGAALTFTEALRTYETEVVARLKGADTYGYWLTELHAASFANESLAALSPFVVAAWRDRQSKQHRPSTVVRKLGLLSGFFTWAWKERGLIASNPVAAIKKPKVSDARDRVLSDDERGYVLAGASAGRSDTEAWLPDALTVLLQTAMRRGELAGLQRGHIDWTRATAHLPDTKSGTARDVPLCPRAIEALQRLDSLVEKREQAAAGAAAGMVPKQDSGRLVPVVHAEALTKAFRRAVARGRVMYEADCKRRGEKPSAGFLRDVRLHDLRHCAVSAWARTGSLSLPELMKVSGHTTLRMVTRYAHLSSEHVAAKMAALSQVPSA